jgi:MoaA/NifB/PqqE/SkfB family radical SAM enzyme
MKKQSYHIHNSFRFLRETPDFLKYGKVNWSCDSPYLYFSISPQGYFLPCVDLKGTNSMLDDDFVDVFYSKKFQDSIRDAVEKCPGCFYACYPEISYFCRDLITFVERIKQGYRIFNTTRITVSYQDSLSLIEQIRKEE